MSWKFKEGEADAEKQRGMQRVGSSEGRFMKGKEKPASDSLEGIMDVLSQMEGGKTR